MLKKISVLSTLMVFIMSGCGSGFFSPETDYGTDAQGNTIMLDTPKNWENWVLYMNGHIADEVSGKQVPGGGGLGTTWIEFWQRLLSNIDANHQENPQRYINYIIKKRQQAGLPPLQE